MRKRWPSRNVSVLVFLFLKFQWQLLKNKMLPTPKPSHTLHHGQRTAHRRQRAACRRFWIPHHRQRCPEKCLQNQEQNPRFPVPSLLLAPSLCAWVSQVHAQFKPSSLTSRTSSIRLHFHLHTAEGGRGRDQSGWVFFSASFLCFFFWPCRAAYGIDLNFYRSMKVHQGIEKMLVEDAD